MDCDEFIQCFSDFLDGEFEKHPLGEYIQHLQSCAECREYDRVMRRGLRVVRELDAPEPVDLMPRLQRSFLSDRDRSDVIGEYAKAAGIAGLMITGALVLASMPMLRPNGGLLELPPVVVEAETSVRPSHSLWGPPPTFQASASFMTVPNLAERRLLQRPMERFSLFREPVGARLGGASRAASGDRLVSERAEVSPE
jgi:hypothetical protein